ncbi:hypothetical protein P7C73_g133, partial [Tremellales sp. Uapishka_1]
MSVFTTSRLVGKTVLITGASAGIGAATALLFARTGANLILLARRLPNLEAVKAKCEEAYKTGGFKGRVEIFESDLTKLNELDGLLGKLKGEKVDILVNNAGMVKGREQVGEIADADVDIMIQTNVLSLIKLTQIFVREFKKQNSGVRLTCFFRFLPPILSRTRASAPLPPHPSPPTLPIIPSEVPHVINLGSIAGREPYAGGAIYCATKHAVSAFNGSLLRELVDTPIRVTEIQPGMVETEFSIVRFRGDKAAADATYKGLDPLTAQDIAEEIVWAASRPDHVNIAQSLIYPVAQASATLNYRRPE